MPTLKEMMIEELLSQAAYSPVMKDIIIIVRDQFSYVKKCVDSIFNNTVNFNLYIWDNGSGPETADYLRSLEGDGVMIVRSEENEGFILPNNRLAALGESPYLVLLNSDTEVKSGWDEALIGWLQNNPSTGLVGFEGGLMNAEGMGINVNSGAEIDYVAGWCIAMSRETYGTLGLFDEKNLSFAYCEDTDLGLRAKEAGIGVYALNLELVLHHANRTSRAVSRERNMKPEFLANHEYIRRRWEKYLSEERVLLRYPDVERAIKTSLSEVADKFLTNSIGQTEVAARF
jgi:GT2 family glycosyltransferase